MREILFRGKRYDDGNWVEGYLIHDEFCNTHIPYIGYLCDAGHDVDIAEIILGTVGQFTGLTDKNGKKIFEGDVLDCKSGLYERCKVIFNEFCSAFQLMCADGFSDFFLCSINHKEMEIIGNIHDNPELLEVTDNG